jgi:hypothetical protein
LLAVYITEFNKNDILVGIDEYVCIASTLSAKVLSIATEQAFSRPLPENYQSENEESGVGCRKRSLAGGHRA